LLGDECGEDACCWLSSAATRFSRLASAFPAGVEYVLVVEGRRSFTWRVEACGPLSLGAVEVIFGRHGSARSRTDGDTALPLTAKDTLL
jgi:hypothetical protein